MAEFVLGISCFYHDSAACLLKDGQVVAAAKEERFSRIKHDNSLPVKAIEFCLKYEGIEIENVNLVAYYEKPILKFDRILNNAFNQAPGSFKPFYLAMKSWLKEKLWIGSILKKQIGFKGKVVYSKHHESHAAAAFYSSEFNESAFLTVDGMGEKASMSFGIADKNGIKTMSEIHFPHSLGLLYSAFTYYCGFKVNSGEYKLMGLAPYGQPKYVDLILGNLIELKDDGSFELNMKFFAYESELKMISDEFIELFGREPRVAESEMDDFYKDVAASIQHVTELALSNLVKEVKSRTKATNLCFSGGVALNCVANSKIKDLNLFENLWINPDSGDAGSAIGSALYAWHVYLNNERKSMSKSLEEQVYLGPEFQDEAVVRSLEKHNITYVELSEENLMQKVSDLLSKDRVIGWFQGRMEFGPRALGNRSILASPITSDMQDKVNLKIKKREGFRPFAPIILAESAQQFFDDIEDAQYMTYTFNCKKANEIPACVHVDRSSRVQTLLKSDNPKLYQLIEKFNELTGCPVLINTSFNERGEPIVCNPDDAINCFFNTDMDALVMNNILLVKKEQGELKFKGRSYELD